MGTKASQFTHHPIYHSYRVISRAEREKMGFLTQPTPQQRKDNTLSEDGAPAQRGKPEQTATMLIEN